MAESESGAERSEDATSKRQEKAREEGQVARSRELNTMFVLMAGAAGLLMYGPAIGRAMSDQMRFNLTLPRAVAFDDKMAAAHLLYSMNIVANELLPLLGLLLVAALAGPILMGGWLFSPAALMPKFSRMNPLEGIKRMFSVTALVELGKSLAKFIVLCGIAFVTINSLKGQLLALGMQPLEVALGAALHMTGWAVLGVSSGMILIAMLDVPFQLFDHNQKLKMTKQEIKEEMKDSEGRPEVKGRIRQLQRELARRRMMEAVPNADVIITNPEHFSVALRYDGSRGGAPMVVAKGTDQIAMKIREIARAHNITQLPAPTLARAIYYTTEIDSEIPAPLYLAVAQVLAYVFQLKTWRAGQGREPQAPDKLPVPTDLVFDQKGKRVTA
ncbi:MAG: flhB [Verrucomicrobiaceae bacterium]|nr:flhB [Verrucomicrobiaceae bacterium]